MATGSALALSANKLISLDLRRMRAEARLSQAGVARQAEIRPEQLSRIESGRGNPTVGTVAKIVRAIESLSASLPARPAGPASDEQLFWNLRQYGAPLVRAGSPEGALSLEETLAGALLLSRRHWAVARVWPVVFARHRRGLDLGKLESRARRLGQVRTLGFLLTLTRKLSKDPGLRGVERRLAKGLHGEPEDFSLVPCGELARELARRRTPPEARAWGFRMNATYEFFESCFRKFMSPHEAVSE